MRSLTRSVSGYWLLMASVFAAMAVITAIVTCFNLHSQLGDVGLMLIIIIVPAIAIKVANMVSARGTDDNIVSNPVSKD